MVNLYYLISNNLSFQNFFVAEAVGNFCEATLVKRCFFKKVEYLYLIMEGLCVKQKRKNLVNSLIILKNLILTIAFKHQLYIYQFNLLNLKLIEHFMLSEAKLEFSKFKFISVKNR